jgi:putative two-component system response regulator
MEKILVVDDNKQNCDLVKDVLMNWGYDVLQAFQGLEAIELAREHQPDVIILDVMLPGMNGFEVCRELKNDSRTKFIPVIFLSVLDDMEDHIRGFEVGGEIFFSKPINNKELQYKIASIIKRKRALDNMEECSRVGEAFCEIMKLTDPGLYDHAVKVKKYCSKVANLLAFSQERFDRLCLGASLHDVGKLVTREEQEVVKAGENIIKPLRMYDWLKFFMGIKRENTGGQESFDGFEKELGEEVLVLNVVHRFVELWEEVEDKKQALVAFKEETAKGLWPPPIVNALEQVLNDEEYLDSLITQN